MASIQINNIGKVYKHYPSHWSRLMDWVTGGRSHSPELKWALKDVSFTVKKGEAVGLVGQNGAGKSTLLKVLTGTTQPTRGRVHTQGTISALLELGLGFHPDFTGRDNATIACQMMGTAHREIKKLLPQIQQFSELGSYFEQPLRVYSTGMQMRLAFSTATVACPDILIIDEALAVGDAHFQHKCIHRIRSFKQKGVTIIFVSHDPQAVKSICDRAILLDQGKSILDGPPDSVLDYYNALIAGKDEGVEISQIRTESGKITTRSGNGQVYIKEVYLKNQKEKETRIFRGGDVAQIGCKIHFNEPLENLTVGFVIRDRLGNDIFGTNTYHIGKRFDRYDAGKEISVSFSVQLNIGCGNFSISMAIHTGDSHIENNSDWWDRCLVFEVIPGETIPFVGLAELPVAVEVVGE